MCVYMCVCVCHGLGKGDSFKGTITLVGWFGFSFKKLRYCVFYWPLFEPCQPLNDVCVFARARA